MLGVILNHVAFGTADALEIFCDVGKLKSAARLCADAASQGGLTSDREHLK